TTDSLTTHAVDQALGRERGHRIQRTEVRRDEAFAIAGAEQQLIGRGPAERDLRVGGAAEVAVIVITNREVGLESRDDRDQELGEERLAGTAATGVVTGGTEHVAGGALRVVVLEVRLIGVLEAEGRRDRAVR